MPHPILSRFAAAAVALALLPLEACRETPRDSGTSIAPRGGASLAHFRLGTAPIYLQTDPRWRTAHLGSTSEPLGSVGCVVCCVSMGIAHHGVAIRPDSLNAALTAADGFTERGWLKWEKVRDVTDGRARVEVPGTLSHAVIDNALRAGCPVLAKVMIRGTIQHWVLIVGKDGLDYVIQDPLGDGVSLDRLDRYGSNIHAIRIVRA